jgi:hypothetical protein
MLPQLRNTQADPAVANAPRAATPSPGAPSPTTPCRQPSGKPYAGPGPGISLLTWTAPSTSACPPGSDPPSRASSTSSAPTGRTPSSGPRNASSSAGPTTSASTSPSGTAGGRAPTDSTPCVHGVSTVSGRRCESASVAEGPLVEVIPPRVSEGRAALGKRRRQ